VDAPTPTRAPDDLVREHAALPRVATLVARGPSPAEVFAAVTREAGALLGARRATLLRIESPECRPFLGKARQIGATLIASAAHDCANGNVDCGP
jgi:GAF domain-containing protein